MKKELNNMMYWLNECIALNLLCIRIIFKLIINQIIRRNIKKKQQIILKNLINIVNLIK